MTKAKKIDMCRIRVKNFGPVKQGMTGGEWIEIKKVTFFIGNQGSGKSSIAKLISTFSWMEKALIRGDFQEKHFTDHNRFRKTYCAYHRIENYFFNEKGEDIAEIEYEGQEYAFTYQNGKLTIKKLTNTQGELTQVMYIPAERNLVSSSKNAKQFKDFSPSLIDFVGEFDIAKQDVKEPVKLPVNNVYVEYDRLNDTVNIKGDGYKVKLPEASSGFQAIVPLFLVSKYYANLVKQQSASGNTSMSPDERERFKKQVSEIWLVNEFSEEQKRDAISSIAKKFNKSAFVNIIEEPEQNLFPISQKEILYHLLEFNNYNSGNKLILTTHSPYLLVYISLCVEANKLKQKANTDELRSQLNEIVPLKSTIDGNDLVVYQLNEIAGTIEKLKDYKGLPSDENKLNDGLGEANEMFSKLLNIEDLCR